MAISETIINSAIYEGSTEYRGIADVTLPDISQLTAEISGAGISGNYTSSIIGHIESMKMTFTFRTITDETYKLATPGAHTLDIRVPQQKRSTGTGAIGIQNIKHTVIASPIKLSLGKIAPASTADASGEYAVSYFASYVDGVKVLEIDPINYIFIMNGVDYLKEVRAALGK